MSGRRFPSSAAPSSSCCSPCGASGCRGPRSRPCSGPSRKTGSPSPTCARPCSACRRCRWAAAIETQGAALRLELATDVADFESALREQRTADALDAYRGELLAGFDDGESEAVDPLGRRSSATACAPPGAPRRWRAWPTRRSSRREAVALSARLLEADPLDEAALRQHMSALARDGQAGAARAAYRQFVERLATDLGLTPGAELRALHDTLDRRASGGERHRPRPRPARPTTASSAARSSCSASPTCSARDECRLLCLIGPGGVGKTRLARRAMQELAPRFADGAVFVPLEDVDTPEQLGLRLAREGGVAAASGNDDPLTRVIDAWREQQLLLVLDNFEQLAEHAAVLDRLLQACARLKILVTSRLRLAVAGEWSMPLEGLPVPDPEDEDRAESFDAVRLFVKAARRVEPDFAAAAESAAIVDICRQVEGLPLAIELAAGWARMLSCRAIADELRHGTELLRAADTRHPPRHASIEAVFEHSWRRLGAVEREALARLSVFHGGFSIEGARAVAGASLPVLGALADKSLLAKDGDRMHLHPLVQQLAALRLGDEAARASTEAAHAAHFHRWLRQLEPASESGDREALQAIDRDFENCRRACRFSIAQGQGDALTHSLPTLLNYFEHRARFAEGLALFQQAIESPLAADRAAARAPAQPGGVDAGPARTLCRSRGDGVARAGRHAPRPAAPGALPGPRGAGRLRGVHRPLRRGPRGLPAGAVAGRGGRAGARDRLDARQPRALREAARPLRRIAAPDARGLAAASPPRRQRPRRAVPEQPGLDVDLHERRRVREAAPARGAAAQRAPRPGLEPRLRARQPDRAGAEGRRRGHGAHACRSRRSRSRKARA